MDTATRSSFIKDYDRRTWAGLGKSQRDEYRKEYIFLRRVCKVDAWLAHGIISRMARVGTWDW